MWFFQMISQAQPCPPSQSQSLLADAGASLRICPRRKLLYSSGKASSSIDHGASEDSCTPETDENQGRSLRTAESVWLISCAALFASAPTPDSSAAPQQGFSGVFLTLIHLWWAAALVTWTAILKHVKSARRVTQNWRQSPSSRAVKPENMMWEEGLLLFYHVWKEFSPVFKFNKVFWLNI